ncbi:hypothetical protein WJX77_000887 [Trebouxia sp. C0004]
MQAPCPGQGQAVQTCQANYSCHEMLDRSTQHTKHCKSCSKAVKVATWLQRGAVVAAAVASLEAAAVLELVRCP